MNKDVHRQIAMLIWILISLKDTNSKIDSGTKRNRFPKSEGRPRRYKIFSLALITTFDLRFGGGRCSFPIVERGVKTEMNRRK